MNIYKELRKLGYCKATVRRAIHGDISNTVRFTKDFIDAETAKKIALGYAGDQNSPIPIYKEANPLYRDSVGTEELHEDTR